MTNLAAIPQRDYIYSVFRTHILQAVEFDRSRVALIVAPTGSGKTSIVRELTVTLNTPSIYISLRGDQSTEDILDRFHSETLKAAFPFIRGNIDSDDSLNPDFILENFCGTIVLDDIHCIEFPSTAFETIVDLVDSSPSTVKWILATRTIGGFPISRWVASGMMGLPVIYSEIFMRSDIKAQDHVLLPGFQRYGFRDMQEELCHNSLGDNNSIFFNRTFLLKTFSYEDCREMLPADVFESMRDLQIYRFLRFDPRTNLYSYNKPFLDNIMEFWVTKNSIEEALHYSVQHLLRLAQYQKALTIALEYQSIYLIEAVVNLAGIDLLNFGLRDLVKRSILILPNSRVRGSGMFLGLLAIVDTFDLDQKDVSRLFSASLDLPDNEHYSVFASLYAIYLIDRGRLFEAIQVVSNISDDCAGPYISYLYAARAMTIVGGRRDTKLVSSYLQKTLDFLDKTYDPRIRARTLFQLALIYELLSDFANTKVCCESAILEANKIGYVVTAGRASMLLYTVASELESIESRSHMIRNIRDFYRRSNDKTMIIFAIEAAIQLGRETGSPEIFVFALELANDLDSSDPLSTRTDRMISMVRLMWDSKWEAASKIGLSIARSDTYESHLLATADQLLCAAGTQNQSRFLQLSNDFQMQINDERQISASSSYWLIRARYRFAIASVVMRKFSKARSMLSSLRKDIRALGSGLSYAVDCLENIIDASEENKGYLEIGKAIIVLRENGFDGIANIFDSLLQERATQ